MISAKTVKFPWQTVRDINVSGKRVLVRVDYNVPLNDKHQIDDDYRIIASLPTIKYLQEQKAKIILIAHLGRPKGQVDEKYSLRPVAERLGELLDQPVLFVDDCIGDAVSEASRSLQSGQVTLLENLRFHSEETSNDFSFAREIVQATDAEVFVQDGFGAVHRSHASTAAITRLLPSVAGLLLEKEYTAIKSATEQPNRPLTTVIGGAKIADKMPLLTRFIEISDYIIVGGAMANNFLKYQGHDVKNSLVQPDSDQLVAQILDLVKRKYGKNVDKHFILPVDVAISLDGQLNSQVKRYDVSLNRIPDGAVIYDIGPNTMQTIDAIVQKSGTVIWNGTLGMAEYEQFSHGSARLALGLARHPHITSIIGGGDTADFVRRWDALHGDSFSHVSTGGGASLELMAGNDLPGIISLRRRLR